MHWTPITRICLHPLQCDATVSSAYDASLQLITVAFRLTVCSRRHSSKHASHLLRVLCYHFALTVSSQEPQHLLFLLALVSSKSLDFEFGRTIIQLTLQSCSCLLYSRATGCTGVDSPGQDGVQAETPAAQQPTQEQDPPRLLQSHPDQGQPLHAVMLTVKPAVPLHHASLSMVFIGLTSLGRSM